MKLKPPWKFLSGMTDQHGPLDVNAAASFDGINVMARWLRRGRGWTVQCYDDESGERRIITDFHDGEPVPAVPPLTARKGNTKEPTMGQETVDFGTALNFIRSPGGRICRKGWHGRGMWVEVRQYADGICLVLSLPDGSIRMGWNASTEDLFAEDWMLLE